MFLQTSKPSKIKDAIIRLAFLAINVWQIGLQLTVIALFSLYVLFSHADRVMPLEGIVSFKCCLMHENSHEGITWSEMGQQNVQSRNVH